MGIPIVYFRLEGPLQSWGTAGILDEHPTCDFPTLSGVLGLIGCALGMREDDPFMENLRSQTVMAARANKTGEIGTDFQTVQAVQGRFMRADGKLKAQSYTKVKHKAYLNDASFTVAITAEPNVVAKIAEAINTPKWIIYLGRKGCVPSTPIFARTTESFASLQEALCCVDGAEEGKEYIIESSAENSDSMYLQCDVLTDAKARRFAPRRVKRERIIGKYVSV